MFDIETKKNTLDNSIENTIFDTKKDLCNLEKEISPTKKKLEEDWMQEHEWIKKAIENYDWGGFLDLSNQLISSDHLETYWSDIVNLRPHVVSFNLENNNIDYIGFMYDLSKIRNLNLSNNKIEDLSSWNQSKKVFDWFVNLEVLDLNNNSFHFFDASFFSDDVKNSIKNLNLNNNANWEGENAIVLSEISLSSLKNLKILKAENNNITSEKLHFWNKEKNKSLEWFYLSGNKINNFVFLEKFPNLQTLDVTKNEFFNLSLVNSGLSKSRILNPWSSFEWIRKSKLKKIYLDKTIGDNRDKLTEMIPGWNEIKKAQEKGLDIVFGNSK
jgi:hypothetical protein